LVVAIQAPTHTAAKPGDRYRNTRSVRSFPFGATERHDWPVSGDNGEVKVELDFAALLRFRTALRRFNRWSEEQAAIAGLTHIQHQLLLAIKGHADPRGPTISDAAEYLLVRHHSVVELATRVEMLGFLARHPDDDDRRVVRLRLTSVGEDRIHALTEVHVRELASLAPLLQALIEGSKPIG
jgi:DNA-binding MarR family transcriptional regulator